MVCTGKQNIQLTIVQIADVVGLTQHLMQRMYLIFLFFSAAVDPQQDVFGKILLSRLSIGTHQFLKGIGFKPVPAKAIALLTQ